MAEDKVVNLPVKESLWDTFEHILLFISLYVFAIAFTLMLHQFIDGISPAAENRNALRYVSKYLVRGYLASLIVSYPLFSFFFLRVKKRAQKNPDVRHLASRKRLIYFTMIVAFIIVLINITSIIYNFLSGNVTLNFLLHFAATVGVASIIFAYLLNEIKEERKAYA